MANSAKIPTPSNPNYLVTITQQDGPANTVNPIYAYMPTDFTYDTQSNWEAPFAQGLGGATIGGIAAAFGIRLATQAMTANLWKGGQESTMQLKLEFFADTDTKQDVRDTMVSLLKLATPSINKMGLLVSPGPQFNAAGIVAAVGNTALDSIKAAGVDTNNAAFKLFNDGKDAAVANLSKIDSTIFGSVIARADPTHTMGDPYKDAVTAWNTEALKQNPGSKMSIDGTPGGSATSSTGKIQFNDVKNAINYKVSIKLGNYAFFDCIVITNVSNVYESHFDVNGRPMHGTCDIQFKPMFTLVQSDLDQIFL